MTASMLSIPLNQPYNTFLTAHLGPGTRSAGPPGTACLPSPKHLYSGTHSCSLPPPHTTHEGAVDRSRTCASAAIVSSSLGDSFSKAMRPVRDLLQL